MTEALKKDYEKTCAERINDQWKQRLEDIKDPEFEGLGFDFVEPNTFEHQLEGYWRWQFSWGGPSDELRAFVNENKEIHRLEYWFMDWMDGAKLALQQEPEWQRLQEMIEMATCFCSLHCFLHRITHTWVQRCWLRTWHGPHCGSTVSPSPFHYTELLV